MAVSYKRYKIIQILAEKNYNDLLPYVGSCSGSGGTFVYKNNELVQASGGGGGWSSQYNCPPSICNSVNTSESIKSKFIIPIESIKFKKKNLFIKNNLLTKNYCLSTFKYLK